MFQSVLQATVVAMTCFRVSVRLNQVNVNDDDVFQSVRQVNVDDGDVFQNVRQVNVDDDDVLQIVHQAGQATAVPATNSSQANSGTIQRW